MGIFSSIFGTQDRLDRNDMAPADRAIQLARSGQISVDIMLQDISRSLILIPLSSPPTMDGDRLISWHPSTMTGPDGAKYFVAFTQRNAHDAFVEQNPAYGYAFEVNPLWVLRHLPSDHGVLFNVHTPNGFEWRAEGVTQFLKKVPGAA